MRHRKRGNMDDRYIFRKELKENYTVLRNELLQDESLSWEARGMLCYLLSKPQDWTVSKKDLENSSPASDYVVSRILKELEDKRYIRRKKKRNDKGQWEWHTWVFDEPIPQNVGDGDTTPQKTRDGSSTDGKLGDIESTETQSTTNEEEPDLVDAMLRYSKNDEYDVDDYPVDVQSIVEKVAKYWGFTIPREGSDKAKWIKFARQIRDIIGTHGLELIDTAWDVWMAETKENGEEPYPNVTDIQSIVSWFKVVKRKKEKGMLQDTDNRRAATKVHR